MIIITAAEKVFTIFISLGTETDHIPSIQSKDDIEKVKITLSVYKKMRRKKETLYVGTY